MSLWIFFLMNNVYLTRTGHLKELNSIYNKNIFFYFKLSPNSEILVKIFQIFCISYLVCCFHKIPEKNKLREELLILAYDSTDWSPLRWEGSEVLRDIASTVQKQKAMKVLILCSPFLLYFHSVSDINLCNNVIHI